MSRLDVARLREAALADDRVVLGGCLALVVVVTVGSLRNQAVVPSGALVLPLIAGGMALAPRRLAVVSAGCALSLLLGLVLRGPDALRVASTVVVALTGVFAHAMARSRSRLGIRGFRAQSMLTELWDRLRVQGELPPVPDGWSADVHLSPAGGARFGGDFLVSASTRSGLELALVDVSGKGVQAGTRALQLAGALGGLLGAVPAEAFLASANSYLMRQEWTEGFATAVYVCVDLDTGHFVVGSAGHPPALRLHADTGRWEQVAVEGPALGLLDGPDLPVIAGRLAHGDALLLYTDGVVERPGRDLDVGIDRLLGHAERQLTRDFAGGSAGLLDAAAPGPGDDRAVVLLRRL